VTSPRPRGTLGGMSDIPPPIAEFVAATNAADSDRFVAVFTDDAFLRDWGREFHGHDGIRAWDRSDNIGKRSRFELHGVEPGEAPDEYRVDVTVSGDGYNGRDTITMVLAGDRIRQVLIG